MYIPASTTSPERRELPVRGRVSKWGNSLGLRIPRALAEDVGLTEGAAIDLWAENGRLVVEPVVSENLESLLAKVTRKNLHGELLSDGPKGREVW